MKASPTFQTKTGSIWKRNFPRNLIIKHPEKGALILFSFCFLFVWVYQPLNVHPSVTLSYEATIFVYSLVVSIIAYCLIKLMIHIPYLSADTDWNLSKEVLFIGLVLIGMGNGVYFSAFLLEEEADRWNVATYVDSLISAILVCGIPFVVLTLTNISKLFESTVHLSESKLKQTGDFSIDTISIESNLKKDELRFKPENLIFAEADGNYVVFHLLTGKGIKKEMIRVSMKSVSEQLEPYTSFLRVHRAFLVNLQHVVSATGSSLGYLIKLGKNDREIPVSRAHVKAFRSVYERFE